MVQLMKLKHLRPWVCNLWPWSWRFVPVKRCRL